MGGGDLSAPRLYRLETPDRSTLAPGSYISVNGRGDLGCGFIVRRPVPRKWLAHALREAAAAVDKGAHPTDKLLNEHVRRLGIEGAVGRVPP